MDHESRSPVAFKLQTPEPQRCPFASIVFLMRDRRVDTELIYQLARYRVARSWPAFLSSSHPELSGGTRQERTTRLRRQYLTELLCHSWEEITADEAAKRCSLFDEDSSVLAHLFSSPKPQETSDIPAQHIDFLRMCLQHTDLSGSSLGYLEETQYRHLPDEWPISNIAQILPERATPAMDVLVDFILAATKPPNGGDAPTDFGLESLFGHPPHAGTSSPKGPYSLRCRPAPPCLWLAVHLAKGNDYAAHALISGGIVNNVDGLYTLDFHDPRVDPDGVQLHSVYDLLRASYMLLRVLFCHRTNEPMRLYSRRPPRMAHEMSEKQGRSTDIESWERARKLAETLKESIREDIRFYARRISMRFHDDDETLYFEEMETEARDRRLLSRQRQQAMFRLL